MSLFNNIGKLLIISTVTSGVALGNGITSKAVSTEYPEQENVTVTVTDAESGEKIASSEDTVIQPRASWDYNRTMDKRVQSMYGSVYMKVSYDRNLTNKTSKITGITKLKNTDSYLELHDKYFSASSATAQYYDRFHKVFVTITINSSECK